MGKYYKGNKLTCKLYVLAISFNLFTSFDNFGNLMWTEARTVVPKFVGPKVKYPKILEYANERVLAISLTPLTQRR